jgi:hypothetical protein
MDMGIFVNILSVKQLLEGREVGLTQLTEGFRLSPDIGLLQSAPNLLNIFDLQSSPESKA